MKRQPNQSSDGGGGLQFGVTKENYVERARAMVAVRGVGFIIARPGAPRSVEITEAQWIAWMNYFDFKGIKHKFMDLHKIVTVPAEWPDDFDGEYTVSIARFARLPRELSGRTPEEMTGMRVRIGGLFRHLSASLDATLPVKRTDPFDTSKLSAETVAEIEARWKSPLKLSEEARQTLPKEDWQDQTF